MICFQSRIPNSIVSIYLQKQLSENDNVANNGAVPTTPTSPTVDSDVPVTPTSPPAAQTPPPGKENQTIIVLILFILISNILIVHHVRADK